MHGLDSFQKLKEEVLKANPVLREMFEQHGTETLYNYMQRYDLTEVDSELPPARKAELLTVFHKQVERLLGTDVATAATAHLKKYYIAFTSEHHGPICSGANPIILSTLKEKHGGNFPFIINLSCANVSLNNFDFPRGLIFNAKSKDSEEGKGALKTHRISFLPSNSHSATVFNFRSFTSEDIKKIKKSLREKMRNFEISPRLFDHLNQLIDEIYGTPSVMACEKYSDQVSKTNYALSQKFFSHDQSLQKPAFIYLEIESFTLELIKDYHLYSPTVINNILFNPDYHKYIDEFFEGIEGAFSHKYKLGSYLFWSVEPGINSRIPLWKKGNNLVSDDEKIVIPLTPDDLKAAIESKKIFPSTMLVFLVVAFYYGLKCLGFFKQINYVTFMKDAYIKLQKKLGQEQEAKLASIINTTDLNGDFALAFMKNGDQIFQSDGIDLALYGQKEPLPTIINNTKAITVGEALSPLFPKFYRVLFAGPTRDPHMLEITADHISTALKLSDKIRPCVTLPTEEFPATRPQN